MRVVNTKWAYRLKEIQSIKSKRLSDVKTTTKNNKQKPKQSKKTNTKSPWKLNKVHEYNLQL